MRLGRPDRATQSSVVACQARAAGEIALDGSTGCAVADAIAPTGVFAPTGNVASNGTVAQTGTGAKTRVVAKASVVAKTRQVDADARCCSAVRRSRVAVAGMADRADAIP